MRELAIGLSVGVAMAFGLLLIVPWVVKFVVWYASFVRDFGM